MVETDHKILMQNWQSTLNFFGISQVWYPEIDLQKTSEEKFDPTLDEDRSSIFT